jgi:MFS family permease
MKARGEISGPDADDSWSALFQRKHLLALAVLAGGVAIHAVFIYVVATVLPLVVREIGGVAYYAWSTTLFMVGSIAGAASAAQAGERIGPRAAYRLALALFAAGSGICALAPTMIALVAGRALQGLGGGLLTALAYASIRQIFPTALRSRAIAMVSGVWGVAALSGPLVGGLFARAGAWRPAFWTAIALAGAFALLAEKVLPLRSDLASRARLPKLRLALLAGAALAVSLGSVPGTVTASAVGIVVAAGLLVALFAAERKAEHRLLPTGAFAPRSTLGATSLTMLLLAGASSVMGFLPYVLVITQGITELTAGYVIATEALAWTTMALLTASAQGPAARRLIAAGPFVTLAGMIGSALALRGGSLPSLVVAIALVGAGIGVSWAHLGTLMIASAKTGEGDTAAACISTIQLLAAAFGSAFAGIVMNLCGLSEATKGVAVVRDAGTILFFVFAASPAVATLTAARSAAGHQAVAPAGR